MTTFEVNISTLTNEQLLELSRWGVITPQSAAREVLVREGFTADELQDIFYLTVDEAHPHVCDKCGRHFTTPQGLGLHTYRVHKRVKK